MVKLRIIVVITEKDLVDCGMDFVPFAASPGPIDHSICTFSEHLDTVITNCILLARPSR